MGTFTYTPKIWKFPITLPINPSEKDINSVSEGNFKYTLSVKRVSIEGITDDKKDFLAKLSISENDEDVWQEFIKPVLLKCKKEGLINRTYFITLPMTVLEKYYDSGFRGAKKFHVQNIYIETVQGNFKFTGHDSSASWSYNNDFSYHTMFMALPEYQKKIDDSALSNNSVKYCDLVGDLTYALYRPENEFPSDWSESKKAQQRTFNLEALERDYLAECEERNIIPYSHARIYDEPYHHTFDGRQNALRLIYQPL
jgi:hypothetical protein